MKSDGSRRDPGRQVSRAMVGVSDEPVRMTVTDVTGDSVAGARVDALVCGWRTGEPVGTFGDEPVTVAYCQWAAVGRVTDESGVVDLGAPSTWRVDAERGGRARLPAPPSIDPTADERLAPAGEAVTRLLVFARYSGSEHDWLGARRLPVGVAIERTESDGGAALELDRKRLFGGEPLVTDLTTDDGIDAPNYQYGVVNLWQRVSGEERPHRLMAEVRAGVQQPGLGLPGQFTALDEERYPTIDAFGPATESDLEGESNQVERAGALRIGRLALDIEERPDPSEERAIELLGDGAESYEGIGRERVQSYFPRTPRFDDSNRYTLANAIAFELNTTPSTGRNVVSANPSNSPARGGGLPLYPAVPDAFTEWRPTSNEDSGDDGGENPAVGAARSLANTLAGETGDALKERAEKVNFSRGVLAGKTLTRATAAYSGLSAFGSLFESAVRDPENELGEGPPFDPNESDQALVQWEFGPGRRRMAAVMEVPFRFTGGSRTRVRLRGGWGLKLRDVSPPETDRVKTDRVLVTDQRVPDANGGGTT